MDIAIMKHATNKQHCAALALRHFSSQLQEVTIRALPLRPKLSITHFVNDIPS
jgi:hypothetical protein